MRNLDFVVDGTRDPESVFHGRRPVKIEYLSRQSVDTRECRSELKVGWDEPQSRLICLHGKRVEAFSVEGGAEERVSVLDMHTAFVQRPLQDCRFSFGDSAKQDVRAKPIGIGGPSVFFVRETRADRS